MKHEIIKTENYLLVVSDDEIKEGDYTLDFEDMIVRKWVSKEQSWIELRKIIAHLPINSPILEGVDLLPKLGQKVGHNVQVDDVDSVLIDSMAMRYRHDFGLLDDKQKQSIRTTMKQLWEEVVGKGFYKAKEKYKYTEEDMRKAFDSGWDSRGPQFDGGWKSKHSFEDFIQSLSQPKLPVGFETEDLGVEIIKNSQGQTVWVGEYIY